MDGLRSPNAKPKAKAESHAVKTLSIQSLFDKGPQDVLFKAPAISAKRRNSSARVSKPAKYIRRAHSHDEDRDTVDLSEDFKSKTMLF